MSRTVSDGHRAIVALRPSASSRAGKAEAKVEVEVEVKIETSAGVSASSA
jgi:hypothetical protein